jgi:hypothetical protein
MTGSSFYGFPHDPAVGRSHDSADQVRYLHIQTRKTGFQRLRIQTHPQKLLAVSSCLAGQSSSLLGGVMTPPYKKQYFFHDNGTPFLKMLKIRRTLTFLP